MSTGPPGASPLKMYFEPFGCESPIPAVGCVMHRTTVSLLATLAVFESSSVNCIPGTTVEIVLNGLRCSLGASGLGSHVSVWLMPPCSKITRTRLALAAGLVCGAARTWVPPSAAIVLPSPIPIKLRRETGRWSCIVRSLRRSIILPVDGLHRAWISLTDYAHRAKLTLCLHAISLTSPVRSFWLPVPQPAWENQWPLPSAVRVPKWR